MFRLSTAPLLSSSRRQSFCLFPWTFCLVLLAAASSASAAPGSIQLTVKETGGIRRTQFPVETHVSLPAGAFKEGTPLRLTTNHTEVPVQVTIEDRWPDQSVRTLDLDFNATIGALASQDYTLQYGEGTPAPAPLRGLAVTEDGDGVQVGNVRFSKSGTPLLASVKYRDEAIGSGANGLLLVDNAGQIHDLGAGIKVELLKRGPLVAAIRYTGSVALDASSAVAIDLRVEMPSSKSWIKTTATIGDPARRLREIGLTTPLALGPPPLVWDFGTAHWTYGVLRTGGDAALLVDAVRAGGASEWSVSNGPSGREQLYETNRADGTPFAGWGHVQSGREVVAWAIENVKALAATHTIAIDGQGRLSYRVAPSAPTDRHQFIFYEHYVAPPVQVGAATSPAAIVSPLVVTVDR